MANLVDRATNNVLAGPDWAMNVEICNIINSDPGQAKYAVKAAKRRLRNKNPRVQLLALTVIETMVKNCGDCVHQQVIERKILLEMVKIVKKLKDEEVREKILTLLDAWQEAFGGPMGRYPQFFMAYDELQHSGFMFPKRVANVAPVFTPAQTHPTAAHTSPLGLGGPASRGEPSDARVMSLSEIHAARSGTEVLLEMLSAIDPANNKALQDDVIVELVEQCCTAQRRVMQLINSTSDEELMRQGLILNDDLQRVLAKHDAIASGKTTGNEHAPSAPRPQLLDLGEPQETVQLSQRVTQETNRQQRTAAPQKTHTPSAPIGDLLSSESYENTSIPLGQPPPIAPLISLHSDSNAQSPLQAQINNQIPGPSSHFNETNYTASWAMPTNGHYPAQKQQDIIMHTPLANSQQEATIDGQSLNLQQEAIIYGGTPQVSQPVTVPYSLPSLSSSPPLSHQGYSSPYNSPHVHMPPPFVSSQHMYGSPQLQAQENLDSATQFAPPVAISDSSKYSDLPPAPWSTDTASPILYENTVATPLSPRQQSYQQQQQQQQQQQMLMAGQQFTPGIMNLPGQMQNLSLQGGYYLSPQTTVANYNNHYSGNSSLQTPAFVKVNNPQDKLFKDLVDFRKSKDTGPSMK